MEEGYKENMPKFWDK